MTEKHLANRQSGSSGSSELNAYNRRAFEDLHSLAGYFGQHPTLGISVLYLSLSTFGLFYLMQFFTRFSVDIIQHLEVTDFMLAAFHHPMSVVISVAFGLLMWMSNEIDKSMRKIKGYGKVIDAANKPFLKLPPLLLYGGVALICISVGVDFAAAREAKRFKENEVSGYNLHLSKPLHGDGQDTFMNIQVLSDTSKLLWIRDPETKKLYAVPQYHVAALTPIVEKEESEVTVEDAASDTSGEQDDAK